MLELDLLLLPFFEEVFSELETGEQQAFIKLRWNGEFVLRNVGKRNIMINNVAVESGRRAALAPHSLIEVGGLRLMFLPNPTLVRASEPEPF